MTDDERSRETLPELIAANAEMMVQTILDSSRRRGSPSCHEIHLHRMTSTNSLRSDKTLQEAIENLLIKERLDLSPRLRELDEKVEQIELNA